MLGLGVFLHSFLITNAKLSYCKKKNLHMYHIHFTGHFSQHVLK